MPDLDVTQAIRVLVTHDFEGVSEELLKYFCERIRIKENKIQRQKQKICDHEFAVKGSTRKIEELTNYFERARYVFCKKCNIMEYSYFQDICEHTYKKCANANIKHIYICCIYCLKHGFNERVRECQKDHSWTRIKNQKKYELTGGEDSGMKLYFCKNCDCYRTEPDYSY